MEKIIYKDESYSIMGVCFEVYKQKGLGFVESVYQECLGIEMAIQNISFKSQQSLSLDYKGRILKHSYIPDIICYGKIIVELKAVKNLADEHRAQGINYLKATGFKLGILVNFSHYSRLEYERIVL